MALVVGGETDGVSQAVAAQADVLVQIPMEAPVESLNVGVAAGIGIYELRTRMVLAMLTERIRGTIGRDLGVTARFVKDALDQVTRQDAGLSSVQVIALMVTTAERHTAAAELRRDLGVGADELDTMLAPLLKRGWLAHQDATWAITTAGEQALAVLWPLQQQVEEQLLDGLTSAERDTLRDLLGRIQNNAARLLTQPPPPPPPGIS